MKKPKTLGQIAYEAHYETYGDKARWHIECNEEQDRYKAVARAVQREVLRREKARAKKRWMRGSKYDD